MQPSFRMEIVEIQAQSSSDRHLIDFQFCRDVEWTLRVKRFANSHGIVLLGLVARRCETSEMGQDRRLANDW